ncbi:MAG: AsmA family protein, partial [Bacteroidetes bacterium]|nr:AsmA family protein [Bacteroidota bacterium]
MRKGLTKISVFILSLLILVSAQAIIFLNSEHFQNYLIEKITKYYSEELKCEVSIKHVKFKITHFELDSVVINDQQGDSLCRIASLDLYPRPSTLLTRHITINKVVCHNGRFNFMIHPGVKGTNIDFLRKYFIKKSTNKVKRAPAIFDVTDIQMDDCQISWSDKRKKVHPEELDLNYLVFNHLNAGLNHFRLIGDSINAHLSYFDFTEKCGWRVDKLETDLIVSDHEMRFSNFDLVTPHSHIKRYLQLTYDDYEDLEEPIDSIIFTGEIRESQISFKDLRYFNHILEDMDQKFLANGNFTGHINNLRTTNVELKYGKGTVFKGKARFRGLPEVDETYMDINAEEMLTNYDDLSTILMTSELPSQVKNLKNIKFKGHFNGFIHDFVTDGNFESDIGSLTSNMNMKIPLDNSLPTYSGDFAFTKFDLGKFYEISELGTTDLVATVKKGKGFKLKDLEADLEADISRLNFHQYDYSNTKIVGKIANKKFIGKLNTDDQNIKLSFDGMIDMKGKQPIFKY